MISPRPAFEKVCETFRGKIMRYAMQLCRNTEDAEDLTQETLIRAYRAYDRFENERPIENWLIKIACNAYLDTLRRANHRPKTVSDTDFPSGEETGLYGGFSSPLDDYIEVLDRRNRIREAIRLADPAARDLLIRAYFKEDPHSVIAHDLDIKKCTLRTRLYRARDRVRRRMAKAQLPALAA